MFVLKVTDTVQYGIVLGERGYLIVMNDLRHMPQRLDETLDLKLATLDGSEDVQRLGLDEILQKVEECPIQEFAIAWGISAAVERNYRLLQKSARGIRANVPWPAWT